MAFRSNALTFRQKQILRRVAWVTLGLAAGPLVGAIVGRLSAAPATLADGPGVIPSKVYVARPVQLDDESVVAQAAPTKPMPATASPSNLIAQPAPSAAWAPLQGLEEKAGDRIDALSAFEVRVPQLLGRQAGTVEAPQSIWIAPPGGQLGVTSGFVTSSPVTSRPGGGPTPQVTAPASTFAGLRESFIAVALTTPAAASIEPQSARTVLLDEFNEPVPPIVEAGPKDYLPAPAPLDPPIPTDSPLMRGLGSGKEDSWIDKSRLLVGGYVQGGFTYNPNRSGGDLNFGRVFDESFANAPQLDQLELSVARIPARDKFDIGGRIEVIYGYDTARFHSNGLNGYFGCNDDLSPTAQDHDRHDPRNQIDLTQAYLDVNLEVGTGLLVRLGKFVTPLGFETIDPNSTPFYSRSYLFGYAKPFTHTGILLNYRFDEEFELWGGVVRGWDQALDDSNNDVSVIGRFDWRPDARINVRAGMIWGRESEQCDCGCPDSNSSRILFDVVTTYAATDDLTLGAEGLYGRSGGADANNRSAEWFGFAGYSSYYLAPGIDLNGRVEWFRDGDGTRLQNGESIELLSLTLGVSVRPFRNSRTLSGLRLQPEVRYDHATRREFDGGSRNNQYTFGIGVLYAF